MSLCKGPLATIATCSLGMSQVNIEQRPIFQCGPLLMDYNANSQNSEPVESLGKDGEIALIGGNLTLCTHKREKAFH